MSNEQRLLENIAKDKNRSYKDILLVRNSIFEFTKSAIESGERRAIRLHKLGIFKVKVERERKLQEKGLL